MNPSNVTAEPISRLIDELVKLPGVGPKTAQRLCYFILRMPADEARKMAEAIVAVKERLSQCSRCFNMTEHDPCPICANPNRDQSVICVVEQPLDILALERTHSYRGLYHVLHGVLSPIEGIGPDDLRIAELLSRVRAGGVAEVILAMNLDLEGEATATYLSKLLADTRVRVTRPARGLPSGGDLEYADEVTLARALEGRREFR
jgi:recombination protein RecR